MLTNAVLIQKPTVAIYITESNIMTFWDSGVIMAVIPAKVRRSHAGSVVLLQDS